MASTIAGLFTNAKQGEAALDELKSAGFSSAQISELADDEDEAPKKLSNPIADFFKDHTSSSSDFQESLVHLGMMESEAQFFEDGVARGGAVITVKADERADEAIRILRKHGAQSAPGHGTMNASDTAYDETAPTAAADAIAGGLAGAGAGLSISAGVAVVPAVAVCACSGASGGASARRAALRSAISS